jgi:hypothetical protein
MCCGNSALKQETVQSSMACYVIYFYKSSTVIIMSFLRSYLVRAMAQAVGCRPLTVGDRVRVRVSPRENCGGQSGNSNIILLQLLLI